VLDNNGKEIDEAHYFLLQTFPLTKSLKVAMTKLFELMNNIFKYGKFLPEFNVTLPFHRWGKPKIRAYISSATLSSLFPSIGTRFNIQEIETVAVSALTRLFIEYFNSAGVLTKNISHYQ